MTVAVVSASGLVALNLLAWPLLGRLGADSLSPAGRLALGAVLAEVGLLLPLLAILGGARLGLRESLGLARPRALPTAAALLAVLGGGVLLDELMFLAVQALPWLRSPALDEVGRTLAGAGPAAALALLVPLAVGPALVEEALCRGAVQRGLARGLPGWLAVVASSLYFGALHLDRLHAPTAFLMGLLLGLIALRTGSVWPAVAAHFVNNVVSVLSPALGGPSLPEVLDRGHGPGLVAAGLAATAVGLACLLWTTRSPTERPPRCASRARST